jgi:DNA-binding transcriptional ArsR family regulator
MERIPDELDRIFEALANPHRREIVYLVGLRPHAVSELARVRGMTLPAIHRHVRILEDAGLVLRRKVGRTNVLTIGRPAIATLQEWLAGYHAYWGSTAESLRNYEAHLEGLAGPTDEETER